MTKNAKMNRRGFLASQAALAATAAGLSAAPATPATATGARPDWATATAADLERFIGDRFLVSAPDTGNVVIRLVEVEAVPFGPHAPAHLPRSESVIAVFDSPDKAPIETGGQLTRRVSHPVLGAADLFIGPDRKRDGSNQLVVTLG